MCTTKRKIVLKLENQSNPLFQFWKSLELPITELFDKNDVKLSEIVYNDLDMTKTCVIGYKNFADLAKTFMLVKGYSTKQGLDIGLVSTTDIVTDELQTLECCTKINEYKQKPMPSLIHV